MQHYETRAGGGGILPLPPEVRRTFQIEEGDLVDFYVEEHTASIRVIVRNKRIADLAGRLADVSPSLSMTDMARTIGDYLDEKHARIDRESREWREFEAWKKAGKPLAAE